MGDKDAWAPRIAQGSETLLKHALGGFQGSTGVMPPKGGRMDLSDADVTAAIAYMVSQSQ
jgi:cytochrome c